MSDDRVMDALQEQFGGMVTDYVVVATKMNENGECQVVFDAPDGQRATTTLGLLDFAIAVERQSAVVQWFTEDETEDED